MRIKSRGFTLIEMLVALGLSVAVLTFALQLAKNFSNLYTQNRDILESESDLMFVERDLRKHFDRAAGIAITQSAAPGPTANFALARSGAVVLASDLRPCATFSPLTPVVPANLSQVRISCCGIDQVIAANAPLGGPRVNIRSQCRTSTGLSIEVVRNRVTEYARCYPRISEIDVAVTGFNYLTQSSIYYWNIAFPSGLAVAGGTGVAEQRSRLQLYLSPGFTGNQEAVVCQEPAVFGI